MKRVFRVSVLEAALKEVTAAEVVRRIVNVFRVSDDAARMRLRRARAGEELTADVWGSVLQGLQIPEDRYEEFLEPLPGGAPGPGLAPVPPPLAGAFGLKAEAEPIPSTQTLVMDETGAAAKGCRLVLTISNAGTRPFTVCGLRLRVEGGATDGLYVRCAQGTGPATGAGEELDRTVVTIDDQGYSGEWVLGGGRGSRPIDPSGDDLCRLADGGRLQFKVAPGDVERLLVDIWVAGAGRFRVELSALAVDAAMKPVAKRVEPFWMTSGGQL